MKVVEDHHDRAMPCEPLEKGAHALVETEPSACGVKRREGLGRPDDLGHLGHHLGDHGRHRLQRRAEHVRGNGGEECPYDLGPAPERWGAFPFLRGAPGHDRPGGGRAGRRLLQQAGLPDSRLADNQDDTGFSLPQVEERAVDGGQLALPPDESAGRELGTGRRAGTVLRHAAGPGGPR